MNLFVNNGGIAFSCVITCYYMIVIALYFKFGQKQAYTKAQMNMHTVYKEARVLS